jgi:uncharacterized protein
MTPTPPGQPPAPPSKPRMVPCPSCKAPALFSPDNPYRPFCSARCQGYDFGSWANEDYRVGTPPPAQESD